MNIQDNGRWEGLWATLQICGGIVIFMLFMVAGIGFAESALKPNITPIRAILCGNRVVGKHEQLTLRDEMLAEGCGEDTFVWTRAGSEGIHGFGWRLVIGE